MLYDKNLRIFIRDFSALILPNGAEAPGRMLYEKSCFLSGIKRRNKTALS